MSSVTAEADNGCHLLEAVELLNGDGLLVPLLFFFVLDKFTIAPLSVKNAICLSALCSRGGEFVVDVLDVVGGVCACFSSIANQSALHSFFSNRSTNLWPNLLLRLAADLLALSVNSFGEVGGFLISFKILVNGIGYKTRQ